MAPSPTADATRLTEPCRTSPAANEPGTLVSKKKGVRASGQHSGVRPWRSRSGSSDQVTGFVADDGRILRPLGIRHTADANKQSASWDQALRAIAHVTDLDFTQHRLAL